MVGVMLTAPVLSMLKTMTPMASVLALSLATVACAEIAKEVAKSVKWVAKPASLMED